MTNKRPKKSFFEITKIDCENFLANLPNKKNIILDFGCGNGVFPPDFNDKKVKLIKMYDTNKELKNYIVKKYKKNSRIKWENNLNSKYNVVLINSTIQYISPRQYKFLINNFFLRKVERIIISDIPKFPFYIESFFCLFVNLKKILISLKYLFQKNYNFYNFKKLKELIVYNKNYKFKIYKNLNNDKILRYSIIYERN